MDGYVWWLVSADTKRKVEQISEELRTLDQILSKDESKEVAEMDKLGKEDVTRGDEPSSGTEGKGPCIFIHSNSTSFNLCTRVFFIVELYICLLLFPFVVLRADAVVAENELAGKEPEDRDFWEGVTKQENTETKTPEAEVN